MIYELLIETYAVTMYWVSWSNLYLYLLFWFYHLPVLKQPRLTLSNRFICLATFSIFIIEVLIWLVALSLWENKFPLRDWDQVSFYIITFTDIYGLHLRLLFLLLLQYLETQSKSNSKKEEDLLLGKTKRKHCKS